MPDWIGPTLPEIEKARARLKDYVRVTPVWEWKGKGLIDAIGKDTAVFAKLEIFQHGSSFKPRGAFAVMLNLTPEQLARGVCAVSAGNHAIAVAYCARILGTSAKVVMPKTASRTRMETCHAYGAEVCLADDFHQAFVEVKSVEESEGRALIHPYENPLTVLGTATLGAEWAEQAPELDAVIIPIGGGGLCAGIASAFKQLQPHCKVIGVEPEGADTMNRSFERGEPAIIDKVHTIADSLSPPLVLPYTFGVCRAHVDRLLRISDDEMRRAMKLLFYDLKFAVEPAAAASTAALVKLAAELSGKQIGIIFSGSNYDLTSFHKELQKI